MYLLLKISSVLLLENSFLHTVNIEKEDWLKKCSREMNLVIIFRQFL